MNHKYLILLLFIFLVFLMGSVNSTVTNVFYNNTTGIQDHALLMNLSYADSNHTGFQSSSTLDNDIATLGYVTNTTMAHDNEKANKTSEIMYNLTVRQDFFVADSAVKFINGTDFGVLGTIDNYENNVTSQITSRTLIGRSLNKTTNTVELGKYGNQQTGYIMQLNSVFGSEGVVRYRYYPIGSITPQTFFSSSETNTTVTLGNFTVSTLAGSGNAYVCVDSTGKQYRGSPAC